MSSEVSELEELQEKDSERSLRMRFLKYLEAKGYDTAFSVFAAIFYELGATIKKVFRYLFGYKRHFNYYGLNPKELSEEQRNHDPVILLHGNHSNQSTWFSLAKKLQNDYEGPVFTVNLPSDDYTQRDIDIIETKITDIKNLYGEHDVVTHMVGHSRGASLGYFMSINQECWYTKDGNIWVYPEKKYRPDIGRVVMMASGQDPYGYFDNEQIAYKFRYMEAANDLLWTETLNMKEDHKAVVESAHGGLVNNKDAHQHLCRWLNEVSQYSQSENKLQEELVVSKN